MVPDAALDAFDPFAGPELASAFPTTRSQLEIWTATQMGGDAALAYNEAVTLHLAGALDPQALRSAITALIKRHESLRSTFSRDGLTMLVGGMSPKAATSHDLRGLGEAARDAALAAVQSRAVTTPFDLAQGPLATFDIVRLSDEMHAVVISAHHLVCDGWSFGVLARDLGALYDDLRRGGSSASENVGDPDRFSTYAEGVRAKSASAAGAAAARFWAAQFATVPDPLDLPSDRSRPSTRAYAAAREDVHLPQALLSAIQGMGARRGVSLFATLLGGFASLLSRLGGTDDLVVGTTIAGQLGSDSPNVVGHCVNTLPIRLRIVSDEPFDAYLARVRSTALDAFEHQQVGFGQIVEQLSLPRDPSRVPLMSVMFNLDRALTPAMLAFGGLEVWMTSIPRHAENFDLFLNAIEVGDGMVLECQYNTGLFDAATVRRWLSSYQRLLQSAVEAPSTPLGRLAITTVADDDALARCNDTARTWPDTRLAHQLFEAQVAKSPQAVVVEQDDGLLTYEALNARANRLAHHLRSVGVRRGSFVGLHLDRRPDTLAALLAVLKAGGAYVPLDPSWPQERLSVMAADAALTAVITTAGLRDEAQGLGASVITVDADTELLAAMPATDLPPNGDAATPMDPAYVIFTSGSTGRPKGVLVSHGALVNLLRSVQTTPGLARSDVVLAVTPLSFDISISEVLLPLTVGARIVLATRDTASDGMELRRLVESRGVTFIDATPATYRLLLAAGWSGGAHLRLICTGEALPRELATALLPCARELWNGYGPTETTVWSTFHRIAPGAGAILIGRPIANTRVAIRDVLGQQVPIGVAGELYIGGAGVALGYLHNAALTGERFTDDPEAPGLRWYRTGDLVRLLPSGEIECLGRADDQVKIRGYRIEPGEIAAVASTWPGVRQCVVMARTGVHGGDLRLVAYVVADAGTAFGDAFRQHLRRALPEYMIPSAVVALAAMPLTSSGKVDRKRLPDPEPAAASVTVMVAPRTDTERLLAELWEQALRVGRVGIEDDFFALGGHSLLASQVLARLRRDHGIELTFRRLFELPTIAQLAAHIDAERTAGTATAIRPAIAARTGATSAPLTAQQERLQLLEELEPARRVTHSHAASWELTGALDVRALEQAFHALLQRHAILRTSFHVRNGERVQMVHEESAFTLGRLDLTTLKAPVQQAALDTFFVAQQSQPFDLDRAPLLRATLIALGPDRHRLYTLQHGMIWDGWSFDLFLRDLSELYAAAIDGRAPSLPALGVTFGDFAAWQRDWLAGDLAQAHRQWWDARLDGSTEAVDLPTERSRALAPSHVGGQRSVQLDAAEVEALTRFAQQQDATLFMVAFSAFTTLLHRYTGQRDLLVASPMRARTQAELEDVLGPFVNTIVLRQAMPTGITFREVVRAARESALDSYAHQELPFESLGGRLPALHVVFSMQDARTRPTHFGPLPLTQVHVPLQFANNDVTLWLVQFPERLYAVLNFSTDVFDDAAADLFLAQLQALLRAVRQSPDVPVAGLPLRTALDDGTVALPTASLDAHSAGSSVLAQLAQCAAEHPEAIALSDRRGQLSYGALWQRATALAAGVVARGVRAGDVVSAELPAGIDRVVAVLGALRAGARMTIIAPEEGAAYRRRLLAAANPSLRIAAASASVGADAPVASVAALEADGVPTAALLDIETASAAAGLLLPGADPIAQLSLHWQPLARIGVQAAALCDVLQSPSPGSVLHAVPFASPAWASSVLAALLDGVTVRLVADDSIGDAIDLSEEFEGCTRMIGVAEAWRATLDAAWDGGAFQRGVVIGDALGDAALQMLASFGTALTIVAGDAADGAMSWMQPVDASGGKQPALTAIAGTILRVADAQGDDAIVGLPGALQWARAGIDSGWQQTGRIARRTARGELRMMVDDSPVLWVGGQPLQSALLEAAIRALPAVQDAAVALHTDRHGAAWLVAHVVPTPNQVADGVTLREQLQASLPAAWVPARVVSVQTLARSSAGTVRRGQMVSPFDRADAERLRAEQAPMSADEQIVSSAWAEVLDLPGVGRHDNFFRMGGTSLLCFRVIDVLRTRTQVRLSPRTLLTGTLADVAAELAAQRVVAGR